MCRTGTPLILVLLAGTLMATVAASKPAPQAGGARKSQKWHLLPKIHVSEGCWPQKHSAVVHSVQIAMDKNGGEYAIVDMTLKKPLSFRKLVIMINRCKGALLPSNCEYFTTWSWSVGLCQLALARGVIWTPLVDSIVPPIMCPTPPGRIKVHNGTFDMDVLDTIGSQSGLYDYIWMVEAHVHDGTPEINVCYNTSFEIRRIRQRT